MTQMKIKLYIIKRHNIQFFFNNIYIGDNVNVKVFDESHEKDLEEDINNFLEEQAPEVIDIKFSVSTSVFSEEQLYCFSALIIYK